MNAQDARESLQKVFGVIDAYNEEMGLFALAPDRIGFGFICSPQSGQPKQMQDALTQLLNLPFPERTIAQFCLYRSPDIESVLHGYKAIRSEVCRRDEMIAELTEQRVEFLRNLTETPLGSAAPARLGRTRCMLTWSIKVGLKEPSEQVLREIMDLSISVQAQLKAAGLHGEKVDARGYIRFMESVLNHGDEASWRKSPFGSWDESTQICNQLLDPQTDIRRDAKQLFLGDSCVVRTLHPKNYPEVVWPSMALRYVGDLLTGMRQIRDPYLVTVNVLYPKQETTKGKLERDLAWHIRQASGPFSPYVPQWALKRDSLQATVDGLKAGDRVLRAYVGVAVFANKQERVVQACQDMKQAFTEIGFNLMEDRFVVQELFTQLLPFAGDDQLEKGINRYRTLAARQIVPMLPVLGSWSGTKTPLLTLVARDGNLMTVNPWDSKGGYNILIAAATGSGKSYLSNEAVLNILSVGGVCWIIDRGFSYKPLAEVMGGTYIEFDDNANVNLNPFPLVKNWNDESSLIAALLEVMAAPKGGLDDFQTAALSRVLGEVWDRTKHATMIDDVAKALLAESDERIKDIGHQLYPYTSQGEHGRYFCQGEPVNLDNRLVVLELQQLGGRPALQKVVLLQLLTAIQAKMYTMPLETRKFLLLDESFDLIASEETGNFIVKFYRQVRKFQGSVAVCVQSVADVFATKASRAIMENSENKWLLAQQPESIAAVKKEGQLQMSETAFELMSSVHTVPGAFSEIFVRNSMGIGVGRLIVTPFQNLLYTTKPDEKALRQKLVDSGMSMVEAIRHMLGNRADQRKVV